MNRPVRSRMQGGVGAEGSIPSATRLCEFNFKPIIEIMLN